MVKADCSDKGCAPVQVMRNDVDNTKDRIEEFLKKSENVLDRYVKTGESLSRSVDALGESIKQHDLRLRDGDKGFLDLRHEVNIASKKINDMKNELDDFTAWKKMQEYKDELRERELKEAHELNSCSPNKALVFTKYGTGAGGLIILWELLHYYLKSRGYIP